MTVMARSVLVVIVACMPAVLARAEGAKAPERRYLTLRFEEDWSWLATHASAEPDAFDAVKHVPVGESWSFLLGGSTRLRVESDDGKIVPAGVLEGDSLQRFRTFLHWELRHRNDFRWFTEVRYSGTQSTDRPIGGVWEDDPDVQNFFLEGTIGASTRHPVTIRAGRQELLFGGQKLVSPLDWSNTRRTWDGIAVIARTPRTRTTAFATRPVLKEKHDLDSPSDDVSFTGTTVQIRPKDGHAVEAFAWMLHDSSGKYVSEDAGSSTDVDRLTVGARYEWKAGGWSGDVEAAWQSGDAENDDIRAHMASVSAGHQWAKAPGKPRASFGVDLASGDDSPTDGTAGTFDQLFPLGHAYLGHVDVVGRRNIRAARGQFEAWPAKGVKVEAAIHGFWLDQERDALFDAAGAALRRDATGKAGDDVGEELDVMVSWTFRRHHVVALEVARFWGGKFLERTGGAEDVTWGWLGYEFKF